MRTKVDAKPIIGSTWRYRGTEHPRMAGEKVVVKSVRRFDHVDGDTVTLRDDGLIQALRKGDKLEVVVASEVAGFERESEIETLADPEDLEPLADEPTERPTLGRRW